MKGKGRNVMDTKEKGRKGKAMEGVGGDVSQMK